MDEFGTVPVAIAGVVVGAGLLLLAWALARWLAGRQPRANAAAVTWSPVSVQSASRDDAVLVARADGRVLFANELARQWFGLDGGDPDLMLMARQARSPDSFLELFAAEGQATLEVQTTGPVVSSRRVEAASYRLPSWPERQGQLGHDGLCYVVVLRDTGSLPRLTPEDERVAVAMSAIAEICQTMSASLDLEPTLDAILASVARVIPYDVGEINLWEPDNNCLRNHRRQGNRDYTLAMGLPGDVYQPDQGYTGWIARYRRPLYIPDVSQRKDIRPNVYLDNLAFGAYLGVPLRSGDKLVGTLELISVAPNGFDPTHLRILDTISGQATIAVLNAQRFEAERRRAGELSGLAEVAQAAGSLIDPHELYACLTEPIAKLMRVQLCGFLLYDEQAGALVGQMPFHGVPDVLVALYRIPVPAGSRVNRIWREADHWFSNDASNDPVIEEVGLTDMAGSIGLRQTLIVPLVIGSRRLGIVQVANKPPGEAFDESDARQLTVLARQAAALIDNARLVRETRIRAERAEGLRRIGAIAGSAQPLDDILRLAAEESVRLLGADMAVILLLDEARGELIAHADSAFGIPNEFLSRPFVTMTDPLFRASVTHTRRAFLTNSAQTHPGTLSAPNYRRLILQLDLNCIINAPLVIQERGIGELAVGARRDAQRAFGPADVELLLTIGAQVASAIQRARLAESTDEHLHRRVEQLTALARISRLLNQTLQLDRILTTVYEEALGPATTADYASIVLLDTFGPGRADLASTPESGLPRVMKRVGRRAHAAGGGEAGAGEAAGLSPGEAAVVEGGSSSAQPAARDLRAEPGDRLADDAASALIVPIVYQEKIVGFFHLQSRTPHSFDQTVADFVRAMADQTAVAIGNAQRYEEQLTRSELLRRRADQLSQLFQISRSVRSDQPPAQNLEAIAFGVQEAVGFDVVIMALLDPVNRQLEPTAAAGLPLATVERLKKVTQPWTEIEPLLRDEFRISQSYYIPRRQRLTTGPLPSAAQPAPRPSAEQPGRAWQRDDLLLVPLRGSTGDMLGLMQLDQPRNGQPPDRSTIETLEIFANQAVLAIESARLYQTAEERAAELARRLADLSASYKELDEVSRSLVHKDQELTRLVDELDLRTRRLLSLNHVTEALGSTRDPQALLRGVAEAIAGEMQMEACLIALRVHGLPHAGVEQSPLRIAAAAGLAVPPGADLSHLLPLSAEANPITHTLERHVPLLVRDVERSDWADSPLVIGLAVRAFACVPILLRGRAAGALFVASQKALVSFAHQELDLFTILANQIGVSLENAELYAETQRRLQEQTLLHEMSQDLMLARDAPAAIAERLGRAFNSELCLFSEYDSAAKTVTVRAAYAPASREAARVAPTVGLRYPLDDYPAARLLLDDADRRRSPVILYVDEPEAETRAASFLRAGGYAVLVAAPMVSGDRVVGLIELYAAQRRDFTPEEIRLLQALANQAGVAYESVRLEAAVRERAAQLEALAEVSHAISSTLHADELIAVVLEHLADVIAYDQASLWIAEGSKLKSAAVRGYEDDSQRMGLSPETAASPLLDELASTGRVLVVPDVLADPRFAQVEGGVPRSRSWMGVPLMSKGELLGALVLAKVQAGSYGSLHGELALAFANQVAASLDNARLYQQARQFTQQLERTVAERTRALQFERDRVETLQRITSELSASLDLDRVLQRALTLVNDVVGASQGSIFLIAPQSDRLIYRAALGRNQPLPPGGQPSPFARHEGLVGWVLQHRQAVVIGDLEADPRWIPDVAGRQHRSALAAPLITSDDVLGAIMFFGPEPNAFDEDQLSLVSAAAAQVASAINNAELYRLIRDQAERLGAMLRGQQEEASKSRAILESIADGVVVADAQGRIVLFNAAAARILDLPREIVGQPAAAFVGFYGAVGKSWSSAVARWTADPGSYVPGDYLAERFELEDKRVVSVHLAPVTSGDDYLGSVSLFRDITREVEVDRLKTEFVTTVSHQLRTPLTPIKGYVDALLLGMAGPVDEPQRQILGVIKSNIDRLATLVHDLLDISRIESGKVELELQPVPIGEVIDEVVTALRGRINEEGKPMTVIIQAPPGLSPILADRARIVQVLTNLAYNAFSYTPAGGTITFSAREESGVMEVSVRDTGIGIAPENLQRMFERFYRGEDALVLTTAGTGLGLPIVRSLVEMHNGRLWAESAGVGRGSTFTFLVPLARQGALADG